MSYISIPDFKFGADRRRQRVAGTAGTLWSLQNGVISRGGDIERAKKFVPTYTLPAGTFGMFKVRSQLYVFGSADLAASMPRGVLYQRLISPVGATVSNILDVRSFSGKLYVVAEFTDGEVYHYYDAGRVSDWDAIADGNCDVSTLADYLASKVNNSTAVVASSSAGTITVTAKVPGTPFTITGFTANRGGDNTQNIAVTTVQANVSAVAEIEAAGSLSITGGTQSPGVNTVADITVNGVSLIASTAINFITSNNATAAQVAVNINNNTSTHGYTAAAAGNTVSLLAGPGLGAAVNGFVIAVTTSGNVTATGGAMAGGVTKVDPVAQISVAVLGGLFEPSDVYSIAINGTAFPATGRASGMGLAVATSKNRIWSVAGTLLVGSKLGDPSNFSDTSTSSGKVVLEVSSVSEGTERLIGLAEYNAYLAVFSNTAIRLYSLDADASQIAFYKSIQSTGTLATRAIVAQGSDDVFYLSPTGIRDLRPRDVINVAYVSDIGTAIDPFVRDQINSVTGAVLSQAVSVIEPIDGRFMLAIGTRVFVLSYFVSSKINAWSHFDPGFQITDFATIGTRLYARAGDTIYLYGGLNGTTYPALSETPCVAEFPFLTANSPPVQKLMLAFDMACSNEWHAELLVDPNDETKIVDIGRPTATTYGRPDVAAVGRTTHFALRLTCAGEGFGSVSSLVFTFQGEDKK